MENKKLLRVRELRCGGFEFRYPDGRSCFINSGGTEASYLESKLIGDMVSFSGQVLLNFMRGEFILPNTNIIWYHALDSDSMQEIIKHRLETLVKLGAKESYNHFGQNIHPISRSHFLNLRTNKERLMYLAECHHKSLSEYCSRFGIGHTVLLNNAILKLKEVDWYFPIYPDGGFNKKKTHKAWVQTLNGYLTTKYRLVVEEQSSLQREYYDLIEKQPWLKILNVYDSNQHGESTPAMSIGNTKWVGNKFVVNWGLKENIGHEVYQFDLESGLITKVHPAL